MAVAVALRRWCRGKTVTGGEVAIAEVAMMTEVAAVEVARAEVAVAVSISVSMSRVCGGVGGRCRGGVNGVGTHSGRVVVLVGGGMVIFVRTHK